MQTPQLQPMSSISSEIFVQIFIASDGKWPVVKISHVETTIVYFICITDKKFYKTSVRLSCDCKLFLNFLLKNLY